MDNRLVAQLIAFYKSRGIDLHYLLDDPYFIQLKLDEKIRIIRENAAELEKGSHGKTTAFDIRKYKRGVLEGGIAGALAGGSVGFHLKGFSRASILPTLTAAGMGAIAGAGSSAILKMLDAQKGIRQRVALNHALQKVVDEPTNENAFNVLLLRNIQKSNPEGKGSPVEDFIRKNQEKNKDLAYGRIGDKVKELYFSE